MSRFLKIKNNTKRGYLEAYPGDGVYTNTSNKRGTVQPQMIQTLTSFQDKGVVMNDLRIRKLTPKECWRLMGFDDEDIDKASQVNSNTQLYKQAGNSIVVNVLEAIFKQMNLPKNIRVLELFAGIGACSKALERMNLEPIIVDAVEIDKYAIKSFNAVHDTNFAVQDVTTWNKDIKVDLITHGSPCQDFSLAGKQAGGDEGSGTRSSLMYETIRIVEKLRPKYVIWENVKNILSKKHKHNFDNYLSKMEELGYKNYYQVLNAKDYGIPQNRERVFTVSILGNDDYEFPNGEENENQIKRLFNFSPRQDCRVVYDKNGLSPTLVAGMGEGGGKVPMFIETSFVFPPKQELKLKLKDMLEDNVDEKYYLSEKMIEYISANNEKWTGNNDKSIVNKTIASAINTGEGSRRCDASNYVSNTINENCNLKQVKRLGGIFDTNTKNHQAGSIYDKNGLAPTLDTMQGGWRQPCVNLESDNT